ncbi:MAG: hypothetical protein K2I96_19650 [Lachnospiraceae bacterium]|nr:hypothetical protein [Lachnospiraceae bacterium]
MTSKNLFFKMVRQDFKKRIWCPILIFIAYFLSLEVRLLMVTEQYLKYPGKYCYDIGFYDVVTFVRDHFFGRDASMMSIVTCAAAFLCGISGYTYLHSRTQLDTYHSLPVSRSQLFWSKYISGILQFFLPFVLHVLICAGIASGRDAFTIETVPSMISYTALQLVVFVLAYSISVMAVGLTGNIIVSILGTGVLFMYSAILAILTNLLFDRFFDTYIIYGKEWISDKMWCFSPLSMLLRLFSRPDSTTMEEAKKFFKYDTSFVWVLVVAAIVYSLAAYFIYRKRASEAAGKSIAFCAAEPVIKTMIVIPFSFFSALFFSEISPDTASDSWFLFGLIFGFVVLCILMEIIFRLDIRGALMHKKQFLFNAACTALLFVVLRYDVMGYDTYVPADAQMQSCAVSIHQLMTLHQNIKVSAFGFHYVGAEEYRMANMAMQGNPSVMELARKAAKEQLTYRYFDYYEGIEESPEYVETLNRQENYRTIAFGYKLLNGKIIYRNYIIDIADTDTIRLLADIFDDYDYKLGSTPLFNDGWDIAFDAVECGNNFVTAEIRLTPDMQAKLIETYQKEYGNLALDTVMNEIPVGTIDFVTKDNEYGFTSYSGEMFVYPQFGDTIALLKEYGFDMEERLTADDIETISVRKNNYGTTQSYLYDTSSRFASESVSYIADSVAETDTVEYTDKEQIQQILGSVISEEYSWDISSFADFFDTQYTIVISFDAEDNRRSNYYYFIEGQKPDFVE